MRHGCFQYVKFIKFESNSQPVSLFICVCACCFQYVKFIKFESNSQPAWACHSFLVGCFQYVKFIKFESNSQLKKFKISTDYVVFSMSNL